MADDATSVPSRTPEGRWRQAVVTATVAVVVAAAAFWAGRVTLGTPTTQATSSASNVVVEVTEQQVGQSLTLTTAVTRAKTAAARNVLPGIVTWVGKPGEYQAGQTIYEVNGIGVVVAAGATPFYRDLRHGLTGRDVAELNGMLRAMGYLKVDAGQSFDADTEAAVKRWQKQRGASETGVWRSAR